MNSYVVDLRQTYYKLRRNLWKTYEIHKILCKSGPRTWASLYRRELLLLSIHEHAFCLGNKVRLLLPLKSVPLLLLHAC